MVEKREDEVKASSINFGKIKDEDDFKNILLDGN